ncbi:hypothetical protein FC83_GL002475 [Agrilactobacillus composti DSM 18527 = JCM 14202]|uniref:endopeptidase La n=1 Tax=Agrilactobacillus composti DSM 18527 = JCM 14202 TaxID=1423734 RepID=X0PND7_9LACO|nr:SepM family pheromone-processing serine protease [Agrilactobacillus composti]KRM36601.1 hypothetical protein FC83_GL002475 [Agrilactobacillus composti DSM 18527 = JCM 14202]GAF39072.1 Lon-like protease with PDZ domain [Agrilactobacillus composti DSM 18527 = JCM 14202]
MKSKQQPFYKKNWFKSSALVVGILFVLAFCFLPINYFLESPGTAEQVAQFVKVDQKKDQTKGKYLLTTVRLQQATPLQLIVGHFQPYTDIMSKSEVMGNASSAAYDTLQNYYIENSENTAIAQAFKKAGKPYTLKFIGVYVLDIIEQSNFKNTLKLGDTVSAVNQQHFKSATDFQKYVRKQKVGQKVTVSYLRQGKTKTTTGKLIQLPNSQQAGLGITLTDHTKVSTKEPVKIDAGAIGGPSAGLMFTLQVYDQISGHHLRKGRIVAGTGTIASDGTVGPIGGIDKKVVAAAKAGATIFFAPNDQLTKAERQKTPNYQNNYQIAKSAAKRLGTKMKIVPVQTLDDAIQYLQTTP